MESDAVSRTIPHNPWSVCVSNQGVASLSLTGAWRVCVAVAREGGSMAWDTRSRTCGMAPAIPAAPPNPVITGANTLAFRKLQCENTPALNAVRFS